MRALHFLDWNGTAFAPNNQAIRSIRRMAMNIRTFSRQVSKPPDVTAVKAKQQSTWAAGDYARIGATLQIVGENLCEAMDVRGGQKVLDVAAGNGNATLAAARRYCDVVSTDYVPQLLDRGRMRAEADGFKIEFRAADAEALPFEDGSFDAILSTFGVMFAPDHEKAAGELLRVAKAGGKIGLANWTPDGFVGQMFKTVIRYNPLPAGLQPPGLWGTRDYLNELFLHEARSIESPARQFMMRHRSPQHWIDTFKSHFGPVLKTYALLRADEQQSLTAELLTLIATFNLATDGTMVVPAEYLEVVIVRR
jgi:SAM-dependent methyltransferase